MSIGSLLYTTNDESIPLESLAHNSYKNPLLTISLNQHILENSL